MELRMRPVLRGNNDIQEGDQLEVARKSREVARALNEEKGFPA